MRKQWMWKWRCEAISSYSRKLRYRVSNGSRTLRMNTDEEDLSFECKGWREVNQVGIAVKDCVPARLTHMADALIRVSRHGEMGSLFGVSCRRLQPYRRRYEVARCTHVEGRKHLRIEWPNPCHGGMGSPSGVRCRRPQTGGWWKERLVTWINLELFVTVIVIVLYCCDYICMPYPLGQCKMKVWVWVWYKTTFNSLLPRGLGTGLAHSPFLNEQRVLFSRKYAHPFMPQYMLLC